MTPDAALKDKFDQMVKEEEEHITIAKAMLSRLRSSVS